MKFLIYSAGYYPLIGGSVALNKLAKNLESIGETAFLFHKSGKVEDSVVIYPEVIRGNPLNARRVVRWLLNTPGVIGGDGKFAADDLVFSYTEHYSRGRDYDGLLTAYDWMLDKWVNRGLERSGACYVVRKGWGKMQDKHPEGALRLDGYKSNDELVMAFNRHKMFVSYDAMTMLSVQAALCGCESVVIPEPDLTADEWRRAFPYFEAGVAYGFEEREHAQTTLPWLRRNLEGLELLSIEQTKNFVNKVREWI